MYFLTKDDNVLDKYNKIWNVIKNKLNMKFHSMSVSDKSYVKVKVRELNGKIKTNFLVNEVPKKIALYLHCLHNY